MLDRLSEPEARLNRRLATGRRLLVIRRMSIIAAVTRRAPRSRRVCNMGARMCDCRDEDQIVHVVEQAHRTATHGSASNLPRIPTRTNAELSALTAKVLRMSEILRGW